MTRNIILAIVLVGIGGSIFVLERGDKTLRPGKANVDEKSLSLAVDLSTSTEIAGGMCDNGFCTTTPKVSQPVVVQEKPKLNLPAASDISTPDGFINSEPFTLKEYVGKKIILVDFWTYSCINCQRTTPYLNAWHDKYADKGLLIVGIHTPEFEFEKDYDNVAQAVQKFNIKYPVVLDNDYSTWTSYKNRYWPRKYLVDTTGRIVYDHIGEGAYEETEKKIQELLGELNGTGVAVNGGLVASVVPANESMARSPEVYFGALRNTLAENFTGGIATTFNIDTLPLTFDRDRLYIQGKWKIDNEFARAESSGVKIVFKYYGAKVYMVARGDSTVTVKRDGIVVNTVTVKESQLYTLIDDDVPGEHLMELEINRSGLEVYTFTFG
jgi:thiol-disulfide isomerase/thioredoxin